MTGYVGAIEKLTSENKYFRPLLSKTTVRQSYAELGGVE